MSLPPGSHQTALLDWQVDDWLVAGPSTAFVEGFSGTAKPSSSLTRRNRCCVTRQVSFPPRPRSSSAASPPTRAVVGYQRGNLTHREHRRFPAN